VSGETHKITKAKFIQFITDHRLWTIVTLVVLILLALFWWGVWRFGWGWTGFLGKSFWDLTELLIIPLVLIVGGYYLNQAQRQRELEIAKEGQDTERQIAKDREEERALQSYLETMTKLLLEEDLRNLEEDGEVRSIARSRTMTVLRSLKNSSGRKGSSRKGSILRFLYETKLIYKEQTVVNLEEADLREADLWKANLEKTNLVRADLRKANLASTNLVEANLESANLWRADLERAKLGKANLRDAVLVEAFLWRADLERANLVEALLDGADLWEANLEDADLRGAFYSAETKWPEGFDPDEAGAVISPWSLEQ